MNFQWLSINEYSRIHDVSISTIRRKIKKNEIEHKLEEGKYSLKSIHQEEVPAFDGSAFKKIIELENENRALKEEIIKIQKEKDDLNTLISFYENQKQAELVLEKF